jgi:hypothetical protein
MGWLDSRCLANVGWTNSQGAAPPDRSERYQDEPRDRCAVRPQSGDQSAVEYSAIVSV